MKTGVFQLSMPDYLAEHGVSQSMLKQLARSPAHLREYLDFPNPPTPDQIIGTITHTSVFEPHLFNDSHWVKPLTYTNSKGEVKKWNANANEAKDWLAKHDDRPRLSPTERDEIEEMSECVFQHPAAVLALAQGKAEQSLFCEDANTGLQLKCRSDWMSGNACVDLKTCQDASPNGFSKVVANYGYDLQAAMTLDICNVLGLGKENFLFIAVEKTPPFAVAVYQLDEASIEIGRCKYKRLLTRYLNCVVSDTWEGYSKDIMYLSLPAWSRTAEFNAQLLEDQPAVPALEV